MRFACLTLSFNQGSYLPHAIDSILSQNESIDYLVYDPGSSDESRKIIESYMDRGVRKHFVDGDSGPADGLNQGLKLLTGEIFYYLNSDDVVLPGAFNYVRDFFSKNNTCDVLHGSIQIIDENGLVVRALPSMDFTPKGMVYGYSVVYQQATFFRSSALPVDPFNIENRISWDGELIFDLALSGANIQKTEMVLGQFRIYPESITGSGRYRKLALQQKSELAIKYQGRELYFYEKLFGFLVKKKNAIIRRLNPKIQYLS